MLSYPVQSLTNGQLDLPLLEIPVLLEPTDGLRTGGVLSDTEQAYRQVHYAYFKKFKQNNCTKWIEPRRLVFKTLITVMAGKE